MANTFLALINKDFEKLVESYVELGLFPEGADVEAFRRDFTADLQDFLEPLYGLTLKEINFAEYLDTVMHLAMKHNMRIPSDLLLINKAMLILENLGVRLDPNFDFIAAAEPYASRLARERLSPYRLFEKVSMNIAEAGDLLAHLPKQTKSIIKKVIADDLHVKIVHIGLEHFIRDMDRSSNRVAFAMVISAFLISSAILHSMKVPPILFGLSLPGFLAFGLAFFFGVWLLISIIRSGRL
jgi:ubiquinone biosynthesis protein